MDDDISHLRVDYSGPGFGASAAGSDPMRLFQQWFDAARAEGSLLEANAMALATSTADGCPSVRMVLLKAVDAERAGFTWFTNLSSRKAQEIGSGKPGRAALAWWWPGGGDTPGRQVRAVGRVELLDRAAVREYFASRPLDARVGAAASNQSQPIASRRDLEAQAVAVERDIVEPPEEWGGFTLVADEIEFWQGRHGRLHDRIAFLRASMVDAPPHSTRVTDSHGSDWHRVRLQP